MHPRWGRSFAGLGEATDVHPEQRIEALVNVHRHAEAASDLQGDEAVDQAGVTLALANGIDLITLDLNLGGADGLSIARTVRQSWDLPIIMITGKGDMIDRIVGLEIGADDYIAKPFHLREVLARVRSVLT